MSESGSTKIGYALGGGAARGLSHIGVLKILDEYGVSPDLIVGTSMGALIGALYASGLKARDIEEVVLELDWKRLVLLADVGLPTRGMIQGKRVISLLQSILGDMTFSQLKHDFACVATDIATGEQVILHDGSLIDAVRASISIPGIFTPVLVDDRYLVDGGLVNEVPVSVCRAMGADYVIGVNVLPEPMRIMCNPKKGRNFPVCQLLRVGEIQDKNDAVKESAEHKRSLRLRLNDIHSSIKNILQDHQKQGQNKTSLSRDVVTAERSKENRAKPPGMLEVLTQTLVIAEYRVARENLKDADLVINPEVEEIGFWQFNRSTQAIAAGEKAAREVIRDSKLAGAVKG